MSNPTDVKTRLSEPVISLEHRYRGESPLRTQLYLYKGQYRKLALSMFFYIIKHSPVWILPLVTAAIINVLSAPDQHELSELWVYGGVMALIFLQNIPTHTLYVAFLSQVTRSMETNLRSALARRLQHLSMNFYHRHNTGVLQAKLLRDVEVIEQLNKQLFEVLPSAAITLMIALGVTAVRAPIFLIFFLITVPVVVLVTKTMHQPMDARNRVFRKEVEGMSARLSEMVHLIPITRAHGVEQDEIARVEENLAHVQSAGQRLDGINAAFGATTWVVFQMFNTLCLLTAGYVAYTHLLPLQAGDVILLTGYFNNLTNAVLQIVNVLPQITKGFESIRSLGEILQSPDMENNEGKTPVESVRGDFCFENVSFAYPDTDDSSLENVQLEVQSGETVAFVGQSGSGKSTLLNLVIGFIRPSSGCILLDGRDMNDLDLRTYRHFLSVVSQDTILFEGTVRENILYGAPLIDHAHLEQAIDDANARDFIDQLPNGLETRIGENGSRLSGGQRQRIAIARALIRSPRVLILDEATSALDTASERLIQQALEKLMQGRTTFVVAHRLSTVRNAHRIVVLEQGRIVEVGTHEELMIKRGAYFRLQGVPLNSAAD